MDMRTPYLVANFADVAIIRLLPLWAICYKMLYNPVNHETTRQALLIHTSGDSQILHL